MAGSCAPGPSRLVSPRATRRDRIQATVGRTPVVELETYRRRFFVDPQPPSRFDYVGLNGVTLYFADFAAATAYYEQVLGPPAYVEGDDTRGWRVGETWLTLLRGAKGAPRNVELLFVMQSAEEAERLQAAFVAAGGTGSPPSDQLMYERVRSCPVRDPFGTEILVIAWLGEELADET